jgi:hypothetical protein
MTNEEIKQLRILAEKFIAAVSKKEGQMKKQTKKKSKSKKSK